METFTDDTVVALASFLSPHDMLSLALICKRFGDKHGTNTKRSAVREESTRDVRQRTESISLMEVAAHTVLQTKWSEDERNALPRREDESWIGLYQEFLSVFRLPLQFDKLVGVDIDYVDSTDKTKVFATGSIHGSAICSNIMRAGKHYVSFQVTDDDPSTNYGISCGIMRPTTNDITILEKCYPANCDLSTFSLKDYERLHTDNNVDCCLLSTYYGNGIIRSKWREWKESELRAMNEGQRWHAEMMNRIRSFHWEEEERTQTTNFKIGMALDLDEGTLDVYKNGRRLGTMMSGLVGEYCWVVPLFNEANPEHIEVSVSIGR